MKIVLSILLIGFVLVQNETEEFLLRGGAVSSISKKSPFSLKNITWVIIFGYFSVNIFSDLFAS